MRQFRDEAMGSPSRGGPGPARNSKSIRADEGLGNGQKTWRTGTTQGENRLPGFCGPVAHARPRQLVEGAEVGSESAFEWIVLSPPGAPDVALPIAGSRAGAIGTVNLEFANANEAALPG